MASKSEGLMSEQELSFLKENRKYLRSKVTKLCNNITSNIQSFDGDKCEECKQTLNSYKCKLTESNEKISKGLWIFEQSRDKLNEELDKCEQYDCDILKSIKFLERHMSNHNAPTLMTTPFSPQVSNQIKLPQLPLPEYGHENGENLGLFFTNFENIINKYSLSEYEKFVFLSRQLKGEPLILVKSLQGAHQSYEEAKALLTKAFSSPLAQKFETINKLSNITLSEYGEPFSFVSDMRIITESFKTLDIKSNDILQYFFWRAMPEGLKCQLTNITNCNKPSLEQIEEHIFTAIERWRSLRGVTEAPRVATTPGMVSTFAANVAVSNNAKPFKPCVLCNDDADHSIARCNKYETPLKKVNKLKSLNYCTKCATNSHSSKDCKFNFFKKCIHCSGKHFSFLCQPRGNSGSKPKLETIQSSVVAVDCGMLTSMTTHSTVLPTVLLKFDHSKKAIRALRDSGAQTSFIRATAAANENVKILKHDVLITVNGFNSSVKYKTKLISVDLWFGEHMHSIEALCIPDIPTKFNLPGLSEIALAFQRKGYVLADSFLCDGRDNINNIDLILGANSFHCLPECNVSFGESSMYSDTSMGVLLLGSLNNMKRDLLYLPDRPNCCQPEQLDSVTCHNDAVSEHDHIDLIELNVAVNHVAVDMCVTDDKGMLIESKVDNAAHMLMYENSLDCIDSRDKPVTYENVFDDSCNIVQDELVQDTLSRISRADNGRLIMPLMWDVSVSHLLGKNYRLSRQILQSSINKLQKNKERLLMVDKVIKDQLETGIISRIDDLDDFINEHPKCSFLGHMPIFKMNKETTKCRVVYLSNICERSGDLRFVSHNMAILPGPTLNKKISTSLTLLRFDKYIVTYDIVKAFLAIQLYPEDAERLCFLWVNDAMNNDFSIVGYIMNRLMFGLRCSPAILMLALYKILVIDAQNDEPQLLALKQLMYTMLYMDNGAIGAGVSNELLWAFKQLPQIFSPYQITLQQFATNNAAVKSEIGSDASNSHELLGMLWNTEHDTLCTRKLYIDSNASTKRSILKTIASNYDVLNIAGPLLNRARLFLHSLQLKPNLGWDSPICLEEKRDWNNICKQLNNSPTICIDRHVGNRDRCELVAFTDSSRLMFGTVLYLIDATGNSKFLLAKNRMIGKQLADRSIPCLELQALLLGVETLIDTFNELSGASCLVPVNITDLRLYSDSLVCLNWVLNYTGREAKMNKITTFVMNRLHKISNLCKIKPIVFGYCAGTQNPADAISRAVSYKQLMQTAWVTGLDRDALNTLNNDFSCFMVPSSKFEASHISVATVGTSFANYEPIIDITRYSSFGKLVKVTSFVLRFINTLKHKLKLRNDKYMHVPVLQDCDIDREAIKHVIRSVQIVEFPCLFRYFECKAVPIKDIPPLINKLNIFRDSNGLLRVKTKMQRWRHFNAEEYPLLLSKSSHLTRLITHHIHIKLQHSGLYCTLNEFRKSYYVEHCFSVVKKLLKDCIICRRCNARTVKLSQSPYREFRVSPPNIPFRSVFIDHIGPFLVVDHGNKCKVYILILTCLWSRAISLQFCKDLSVFQFLRCFQLHMFQYGVPEYCYSDHGTSLVSGHRLIDRVLTNSEVKKYLAERKIKQLEFHHYPKGCNELGGLVESCVKLTKRLVFGAIRNLVLSQDDFIFLVSQTQYLVNKRPIAFKSSLRDGSVHNVLPFPITPETLLYGREIDSICVVPSIDVSLEEQSDPTYEQHKPSTREVGESESKLNRARSLLYKLYNEEFIAGLIYQASNKPDRYKPINHKSLCIGDIVLLKEQFAKPSQYPMGIITKVVHNCLGETTEADIKKGLTGETVRRHVTSLIPLINFTECVMDTADGNESDTGHTTNLPLPNRSVSTRAAAVNSRQKTSDLVMQGLL